MQSWVATRKSRKEMTYVPPHYFGGLSLAEWASVIAIITFIATLVSLLFKYAVFGPLRADLKELSKSLSALNASLTELKQDYARLETRVDGHDRRLDRHHEQIKTLYHRGETK